jgi:hypothetical protein
MDAVFSLANNLSCQLLLIAACGSQCVFKGLPNHGSR